MNSKTNQMLIGLIIGLVFIFCSCSNVPLKTPEQYKGYVICNKWVYFGCYVQLKKDSIIVNKVEFIPYDYNRYKQGDTIK